MNPSSTPLVAALREFVLLQEAVPDPRLTAWAQPGPADPRLAILASALSQDLTLAGTARLLRELRSRLGPDLLEPWRRRQEDLGDACRFDWLQAWPHRDHLAGWVTAVGDFLREAGDPAGWPVRWPEPSGFVRALALSIPWMGRKSTERVKGWRVARWLVRGEGLSTPLWPSEQGRALRVPHPIVAVPLGWFGRLPPGWEGLAPRARQEWVDALLGEIDPHDPARAWVPLEGILRRGRLDHLCVERIGGCSRCPLERHCRK